MDHTTGLPLNIDSIANVNAVVLGSSTFDQANREYIFSGPDLSNGNTPRVFKVDVASGIATNTPALTETVNEYQYDLQQQKLFGLGGYIADSTTVPPQYGLRLLAVNTTSALVTQLYQYPQINYVVAGGSTYNSDSSNIIFQAIDTANQNRMYVIDVLTGAILQNPILPNVSGTFFNEWEYDHNTGKLYGLYRDNNNGFIAFVDYDLAANTFNILDTVPGIIGLTPGASVYDQATSTFIFQAVDSAYNTRLITVDATNGQIMYNVLVEGYLVELEIDNSQWGEDRYGSTVGVAEQVREPLSLFPNPAADKIELETAPGVYLMVDSRGAMVEKFIVPQGTKRPDIAHLPSGRYWIVSEDGTSSTSFIKR